MEAMEVSNAVKVILSGCALIIIGSSYPNI